MSQHPIGRLVRPIRDVVGRQIRQTGQNFLDLLAQLRRLGDSLGFGSPILGGLPEERRYILAALLCGTDLPGDTVAPGLRFLGTGLRRAPRLVDREDLLGAWRQTAPL
jgi:hypothetical protein